MPTLDDAPLDTPPAPTHEALFGDVVQQLLDRAVAAKRIRVQVLGRRAEQALTALAQALDREQLIAEAEDRLARLRRGEE